MRHRGASLLFGFLLLVSSSLSRPMPSKNVMLLREVVVTEPTRSIVIDHVPSGFRHLQVVGQARVRVEAGASIPLLLRLNGDTGFDYRYVKQRAQDGAMMVSSAVGATVLDCGDIPAGPSALTNAAGGMVIEIPNYGGMTFGKSVQCRTESTGIGTTPYLTMHLVAGWWDRTEPITQLELFPGSGVFEAGTVISLYGLP